MSRNANFPFVLDDLFEDAGLLIVPYNGTKIAQVCLLPVTKDLGLISLVFHRCGANPLRVQDPRDT